ncbi:MAG: DeoR/GlpR transcriptional regulator [Armatimonadetes bacterium]|nr:DeoR/GlpR transcriptional regulator [Armatimonadota bacterium]
MAAMNGRHIKLVHLLQERGEARIADLVGELGTSEATVRRDLTALEKAGLVSRTFGGARFLDPPSLVVRTFQQKRESMRAAKMRIGARAARLVEPGMSVALTAGTTTWCVAAALRSRAPLTVVTNAMPVIEELGAVEGVRLYCVGGRFNPTNLDFLGTDPAAAFRTFHVDIAFLGADSLIPGRGVFSESPRNAEVPRAMCESSRRSVVVADHTKYNARGTALTVTPDRIGCVIMDAGLDPEAREQLETEPYELILVP